MYEQCIQFWIHSAFLLQLPVLLLGKREDLGVNFSHEEQDPYTYTGNSCKKEKRKKNKKKKKKKNRNSLKSSRCRHIHSLFISLSHLAFVIWFL